MTRLVHVCEHAWGEVAPRAADVHVTLRDERLFSERAALHNAIELRRLVEALVAAGLPEAAVTLAGAELDVTTGLFARGSSVRYHARVRIEELDLLPAALDAIVECRHATLTSITWDHAGSSSAYDELVAGCTRRALARAGVIAQALGVTIEAIHELHQEPVEEPSAAPPAAFAFDKHAVIARRKSVASELAGLALAPRQTRGVRVRLACSVTAPRTR